MSRSRSKHSVGIAASTSAFVGYCFFVIGSQFASPSMATNGRGSSNSQILGTTILESRERSNNAARFQHVRDSTRRRIDKIEQQTNEPIFPPQKPHWIPSGVRASIGAHSAEWLRPKSGGSRNTLRTSAIIIGFLGGSSYTQQTSETSRFV